MRRSAGFTLLELLVGIAIIGVLAALFTTVLGRSTRVQQNASFANGLAQDINRARSRALATGQTYRITFPTTSQYVVSKVSAANAVLTPAVTDVSNSNITLGSVAANDYIQCSSRGFCLAYSAANVQKTISQITVTGYGRTQTLAITALGLTRIVQ